MKRLFLLFTLIVAGIGALHAQSEELTLGFKGGHNAALGPFAAASVEVDYELVDYFAIDGGAQYCSIGRVVAAARPRYFHDFGFGRLSGEVLLDYSYQGRMNSCAIGCGASVDIRGLWVKVGYYHRTMVLGTDRLCEPFNIYYELGVRCLPKLEHWDLDVVLTNCRIFELERHYQPSLAIDARWYPAERVGVLLGVNYKPAGMFNISSDYYQLYANVGVCYRW
ncbi:MAG: hypothetical protein J6V26_06445 [Alistipes sp.]|nr:hypothetical protein [Alistipes sp.]